ncbi:MAG: hypothetical protein HRT89_09975, partial [Lentisphaeria bacterium]|nr:hypothetical protein [Lentisphaeria bacterium]NQZ68388.1 hypothetical protein [Lentisphaeria bacterium]
MPKPLIKIIILFVFILNLGKLIAGEGLITVTFGNNKTCTYPNTLKLAGKTIHFDISALAKGTRLSRAVIRVPQKKIKFNTDFNLIAANQSNAKALKACGPDFKRLDALAICKAWLKDPAKNKGLLLKANNRNINTKHLVLELSFIGPVKEKIPSVSNLKISHREGQTFITWKEPNDIVAEDNPKFELWEKNILAAQKKRSLVYRVYRHNKPINATTISAAKLVREIPEALSCWNKLAIQTLEFPPGTKRSPLWPGKIKIDQVVTRYVIKEGEEAISRTTGLAVISAAKKGIRYYAVSIAINGKESIASFKKGKNASGPIKEVKMVFPQFVTFRKIIPKKNRLSKDPHINVRVAWLEPPYVTKPGPTQFYFCDYPKAAKGTQEKKAPFFLYLSQYGASSRNLGNPLWISTKAAMTQVSGIAFAESEDAFWAGQHQSVGTLRKHDEGIVINHGQRRIMASIAW